MRIAGFQPLSLLDYPERVAAVVFTQGCPLRCVYCHNPELLPVLAPVGTGAPTEDDVCATLARKRRFLDGVVVTGGEPTVQPDLPRFLARLKAIGLLVKLDTNGTHPRMVEEILRRGLVDFVAMDLKHVWSRYADVVGTAQPAIVSNCRRTFDLLRHSGVAREFRTTAYPELHSEDDLSGIVAELGPGDRYALQAIRYGKTLVRGLPRTKTLDLEAVATRLRRERPGLTVEVRG